MTKIKLHLLCAVLFSTHLGIAQITFQVGQASDNSYTKGEAAQLVYTNPSSDTTDTNWLTQGFADFGYTFKTKSGNISFTVIGEIHKNTLIDKQQDTRQWGTTIDWKRSFKDSNGVALAMLNPTLTIKRSNDRTNEEEGMQYIFGITYYPNASGASGIKGILTPDAYWSLINNGIGFKTSYNLGATYATIENEPLNFLQGDVGIDAYLLPGVFDKLMDNYRFIFGSFSYNGRLKIKNDPGKDLDALRKWGVGVDLSIIKLAKAFNKEAKSDNNKITIKHEWISGADPLKGLANQSYSQMTLNVLVNF
ncbi:MAG: hypothetical protein RIC35_07740 [Marinoscillum sp.]